MAIFAQWGADVDQVGSEHNTLLMDRSRRLLVETIYEIIENIHFNVKIQSHIAVTLVVILVLFNVQRLHSNWATIITTYHFVASRLLCFLGLC